MYKSIYYVSVNSGSDKFGDGSAKKPWKTIHYAIKEASFSRVKTAIFVASGIYNQGTITMHPLIDLYGGFNSEKWKRDIIKNKTFLDGEGVRRVVIAADSSRIDGFVVSNGLAQAHGGGILCDDTSPTITNNQIINNLVAEPKEFNDTRIHQDGIHGGGIACMFNAVPVIKNNLFLGNRTSIGNGAGIAFYGWVRLKGAPETEIDRNRMVGGLQAVLENNVFVGNIAGMNDLSRTRSSNGGAISCAFEARPLIRNNVIVANEARGRSDAGGIYCEYFSYPVIEGNWILGNIGDDDGGGIYLMKQSNPLIKDNIVAGNWTLGGGVGGIRLSKEGRARIINNVIFENPGGGLQSVDAYLELEDNIIINHPNDYGVSYSNAFAYMQASIIRNNIIRENGKGALVVSKNTVTMPVFENNNVDDESIKTGKNNANLSPEFLDDHIDGKITNITYDKKYGQSQIKIIESLSDDLVLPGRIFKIGKRWGVIKEYHDNLITVWGDLVVSDTQNLTFEISPTYTRP